MCNPYNHLPLSVLSGKIFDLVLIISVIYNTILTGKLQVRREKFFLLSPYKPTRLLNPAVFSAFAEFSERKRKN